MVTQSLLQSLELMFVHRSLIIETHKSEDSQLAAAELRRLSAFKRELEVSRGKVCLCRGWLQNPVLPGVCVCVCVFDRPGWKSHLCSCKQALRRSSTAGKWDTFR